MAKKKQKKKKAAKVTKKKKVAKKKAKKKIVKKKGAKKEVSLGLLGTTKLYSPVRERISCGSNIVDAIMGGPHDIIDGACVPRPSDGTRATEWGVPVGRIIEVVGGYSTGKSTWVENLAKCVQSHGGDVYMGITEATLDPERMIRIGCDPERIRYNEFEWIEDGFEWVEAVLLKRIEQKDRTPILVTWDTIAASHSKDDRPGSGSRTVREGLRRVTNLVAQANAIMVFINQTSATFNQFEIEPATPFGQGIRFHASIRLEFRGQKKFAEIDGVQKGKQTFTENKAAYGILPVVRTRKNKTFPPMRRARMPVSFLYGLDDEFGLYEYMAAKNKKYLDLAAPVKSRGDVMDQGNLVVFKMAEPCSCYWNDYRNFVRNTRPDVWVWMVDTCRKLAYNGFDPIAS